MDNNIFSILKKKFPEREYALMEEVSDAAGYNRSRSADFVIMNLWPSRGLYLHGIELKKFRSDWLHELKKPEKAENIFQYCDYFSLLTENENVAKLEEIPANWGWMTIKNNKIVIMKDPPKLSPKEMTRSFVACMLKRASSKDNYVLKDEIDVKIEEALERGKKYMKSEVERTQALYDWVKENVTAFEEASGIDIGHNKYTMNLDKSKKIGEAVKFISSTGVDGIVKDLQELQKMSNKISYRIAEALAGMADLTEEKNTDSKYHTDETIN